MSELHVGIDVSRDTHHVVLTDPTATARWGHLTVPNDAGGAVRLGEEVQRVADAHACDHVRCGLEATGVYAWHLALWLAQAPESLTVPTTVYLLQPRSVHAYAQSYGAKRGKTDRQDAWLIAELLDLPKLLPHPFRVADRTLALQRLTRHRFHLVRQMTRLKNYAASYLFLKANGLVQHPPQSDRFGAATQAVLEAYHTVEDIAAASLEDLVQCLQQGAQATRQAAQASFRLPGTLKDPVHQILSWTLQDIRYYQSQLKVVERRIAQEPVTRINRLRTIPGYGPVFSAGTLSEIGDIQYFATDNQLAQFAGITWPAHQSGDFEAEDTPMARTGNVFLRYDLLEAANSVRRYDATYAAFYAKKYAEATKHAHGRALVLTARKLTRLVFALLRDDRAYDPEHVSVLPH